jgi:hypothetical protein
MIFIDIETIPTQSAAEIERIGAEERARNAALAKPHGEAKVAENIDELVRKTALDGASGEVVCIAALSWCEQDRTHREFSWRRDHTVGGSERAMLAQFFTWLQARAENQKLDLALCGHNVVGFDAPFLRQRAYVHRLRPPQRVLAPAKPWEATMRDTMLCWSGGQAGKSISLDRLCRALGVPGKGELDGSGVWDAVRAGRIDEVAAYCIDDVYRSYQCWLRMSHAESGWSAGAELPGHHGVVVASAPKRSIDADDGAVTAEMGVAA